MDCEGHGEGYRHFDQELEGFEERFDIGLKQIVMQVFSEPMPPPYIVASFSFRSPSGERHYLPFAMAASGWSEPDRPQQEDFDRLIASARPVLSRLLGELEGGRYEEPEHPIWVRSGPVGTV